MASDTRLIMTLYKFQCALEDETAKNKTLRRDLGLSDARLTDIKRQLEKAKDEYFKAFDGTLKVFKGKDGTLIQCLNGVVSELKVEELP